MSSTGEWVMARNFDPALQTGPDALTFAELDAVSCDVPVFVMNASGHLAYANRKAFAAANIPENVENPPGAEFVRDGNGRLTGVMKNNVAFLKVTSGSPAMARAEPVAALIDLLTRWSRLCLTTVSELALGTLTGSPHDAALLFAAGRSGRLKARIRAYPFHTLGTDAWDKAGVRPGDGNGLVRIAGYKLVADGSNQGFTGFQKEPYLGSDSRGLPQISAEEMKATAIARARAGWPLALLAEGDAAIDMVLDACEAVKEAGIDPAAIRPRIEHCSMLHDEQIARMRALGVSASFLIGHVHCWGVWMRDRVFGPERANLLGRLGSVERAGVGFTIHSDFMVTDPDPLHMIEMAGTRRTWKEPDFVLNPAERVPVESAIRALTSEVAWQLSSDHEIGSLEPGKFVDRWDVLDRDPRAVPVEDIKEDPGAANLDGRRAGVRGRLRLNRPGWPLDGGGEGRRAGQGGAALFAPRARCPGSASPCHGALARGSNTPGYRANRRSALMSGLGAGSGQAASMRADEESGRLAHCHATLPSLRFGRSCGGEVGGPPRLDHRSSRWQRLRWSART